MNLVVGTQVPRPWHSLCELVPSSPVKKINLAQVLENTGNNIHKVSTVLYSPDSEHSDRHCFILLTVLS